MSDTLREPELAGQTVVVIGGSAGICPDTGPRAGKLVRLRACAEDVIAKVR